MKKQKVLTLLALLSLTLLFCQGCNEKTEEKSKLTVKELEKARLAGSE